MIFWNLTSEARVFTPLTFAISWIIRKWLQPCQLTYSSPIAPKIFNYKNVLQRLNTEVRSAVAVTIINGSRDSIWWYILSRHKSRKSRLSISIFRWQLYASIVLRHAVAITIINGSRYSIRWYILSRHKSRKSRLSILIFRCHMPPYLLNKSYHITWPEVEIIIIMSTYVSWCWRCGWRFWTVWWHITDI